MGKYLTFDFEDWFHILDNPKTSHPDQWKDFPTRIELMLGPILDLCDKHNVKATFFCLGWVAEKYPDLIKRIHQRGHFIGTHGYAHQLVYTQTPEQFRDDLRKSINILENIISTSITAYRAPGFSITSRSLWALDILYEEGIEFDSSIFPAYRGHGGLPWLNVRNPFKIATPKGYLINEYPLSVVKFFGISVPYSGGGYFRIMPRLILSRLFKMSEYQMTYFHPRDFDEEQPKIPGLSGLRHFKSYYGIRRCLANLDFILSRNKITSSALAPLSDEVQTKVFK